MKKIYISAITLISLCGFAQESTLGDVIRLSNENLLGTARYRAMGGAFGAIGADLSGLSVNPAGAALFNDNTASGTLATFIKRNNNTYFGKSNKSSDSSFDMTQIGGVLVYEDKSKYAEWTKFTFGINYDNVGKFDNYTSASGTSDRSIDTYFLNKAQGHIKVKDITVATNETFNGVYKFLGANGSFDAQQALLGYEAFIFESTNDLIDSNKDYFSNVTQTNKYKQTNNVESRGYNGKMAVNFATAYKNKLFLGVNMNFYFTDFRRKSTLIQTNALPFQATQNDLYVDYIEFKNELYTYGSGFSLQVGAIYKLNDNIRIGLNYDSPAWYRLTDELSQSLFTDVNKAGVTVGNNPTPFTRRQVDVAPDVVNVFPIYNIQTTQKITGSLAYIFGKKGLLSVDYGYKDYSSVRIKPKNDGLYANINNQARTLLGVSKELKVGGEIRIAKQLSLRGGYRFEESPFKVDAPYGDLISYSGGLGYNWGDTRLDFSYTNERRNYSDAFLTSNFAYGSRINNVNHNINMTYTISF